MKRTIKIKLATGETYTIVSDPGYTPPEAEEERKEEVKRFFDTVKDYSSMWCEVKALLSSNRQFIILNPEALKSAHFTVEYHS